MRRTTTLCTMSAVLLGTLVSIHLAVSEPGEAHTIVVPASHDVMGPPLELLLGDGSHVCALEDGITWVTADGGCKNLQTGLVWSRKSMGTTGDPWTYPGASQFVADSTEGGYDDWRLPTLDELLTVVANGAQEHFSQDFGCSSWYWSTTKQGRFRWGARICTGATKLLQSGGTAYDAVPFVAVREASTTPPSECNNNGFCDPGEDCENCSDCASKTNGPRSGRFCCGNGVLEGPEDDDMGSVICNGNP